MLSESSPAFQISAPIFPAGVVRIEHTVYCFENWETQHVHICRLLRLLKKWSRSWSLMECHCWLCRKTLISVLKLPISAHFDIVHFQLKLIIWRHSIIESCVSKEKSQELHMETLHNTFLLKIQSQLLYSYIIRLNGANCIYRVLQIEEKNNKTNINNKIIKLNKGVQIVVSHYFALRLILTTINDVFNLTQILMW